MPTVFDRLMISRANIFLNPGDDYSAGVQDYTLVESDVPCRVSIMGPGREFKAQKQFSEATQMVYMRARSYELTAHHALEVNGTKYNVLGVDDPSNMTVADPTNPMAHLEVYVELVTP